MKMATASPKIAIIGAGPVSLTLAAILEQNAIPFTLFEASSDLCHRGGSLDLHPATGQAALKEAGLWDQFVKYARPESDVLKLVDVPSGEVLYDENGEHKQEIAEGEEFSGRPEIDRGALMKVTYESLAPETVKWGKKLNEVVPSKEQPHKYSLHFADGTQEEDFDLVVGGDGAWSRVRPLLTATKPRYAGISHIEVWHNDVAQDRWLVDYVGEGSCFGFHEGQTVQAQRQGDGTLRAYAFLRVPEDFLETCGIDWSDRDAARIQFMKRYYEDVHPDLRRIVLECKDYTVARALYELPVPFTWDSRPGVTLIGDAAHLMTPFAGVGVNVGMTDSLVLAKEIIASCKGEKSLEEALRAYETDMFPRAERFMRDTLRKKEMAFKFGGSKEFADMIKRHVEAAKAAGRGIVRGVE